MLADLDTLIHQVHVDDIPGAEWETILAERCGLPPSHCTLLVKVLHELQVTVSVHLRFVVCRSVLLQQWRRGSTLDVVLTPTCERTLWSSRLSYVFAPLKHRIIYAPERPMRRAHERFKNIHRYIIFSAAVCLRD